MCLLLACLAVGQALRQKQLEQWEKPLARSTSKHQRSHALAEAKGHQHARQEGPAKQLTLRVKDVLGREFSLEFGSKTQLRNLMGVICQRLGLAQSQVTFMHKGRQLKSSETPEAVGLVDQDTIEVDGKVLQNMKAARDKVTQLAAAGQEVAKQLAAAGQEVEKLPAKMAEEARANLEQAVAMPLLMKAEADAAVAARGGERAGRKVQAAKEVEAARTQAKIQAQVAMHNLLGMHGKATGLVSLRFADDRGRRIRMPYMKRNRLSGLLSLVSRRFGLDPTQARFYHKNKEIGSRDTILSLGLRNNALIHVMSS